MESLYDRFYSLSAQAQIRFLKEGELLELSRESQIDFIKSVIKAELSSKTLAAALKRLRELRYKDRFFYRRFLYHVDSSVANAAKRAISDSQDSQDSTSMKLVELVEMCPQEERLSLIQSFFTNQTKISESQFLPLLDIKDPKIRQEIIKSSVQLDLNEERLAKAIVSGKVWSTRKALVEILGLRKSPSLLLVIQELLEDPNVEVKLALIEALEGLERATVHKYLLCLSQDSLIWVRKRAMLALG
jgi:HEAT repeat protein